MTRKVTLIALAMVLACWLSPNAYAVPITVDTFGIVGGISGSGQQKDEDTYAQTLLNLGLGGTTTVDPGVYQANHVYNYAGTIIDNETEVAPTPGGPSIVPSNWLYALAKYDGPNAGYVLFYLPDFGYALPQYSYSIWGDPTQYALSHYTPFNSVSVPDGGSVAMLLGAALVGLAGFRRFVK